MRLPKMRPRNRAIFAAFRAGATIPDLAAAYGLRRSTISAILTTERHKNAISPDPEYRMPRELPQELSQELNVSATLAEERTTL